MPIAPIARRAAALPVTLVFAAAIVGACSDPPAAPSPSASAAAVPTVAPTSTPLASEAAPSAAVADGPPTATLAVEGGDPIEGQLGTFTWGDAGSDSPWLRGASMTVGVGEELTLTVDPTVLVERWTARYVPYDTDSPAGAVVLGAGPGDPRFPSPPPGAWTVDVHVIFADARGEAHYAWAIEVE